MPRRTSLAALIVGCCLALLVGSNVIQAEEFALVLDRPPSAAVERAIQELERALLDHDDTSKRVVALPQDDIQRAFIIGVAGSSPQIDRLLSEHVIELSPEPESLAIKPQKRRLVLAGRDERGVMYAIREVARTWATSRRDVSPWERVIVGSESPYLKTRSVTVHLFNADVERGWYFSEEFWHDYLTQLARQRFNRLSIVFGDQNNYLTPPYPSLVELPEYPQVRVDGLTPEQRTQNVRMLARIAALAAEYGIDLQLGIWMQAPIPRYSAPVEVHGLPEGLELAKFCALGLKRVLQACPAIRGVQLRMNAEAGVPEEQQTAFYQPLFTAIREVDPKIQVELRYKGLQPSTTQAAIDAGLDTTVSTKFWSEHFGLPYHPTEVDSHWRDSRYSFGSMLKKPRPYRVIYRLWNVGSQRLTVWGDPHYASQFAQSCRLGDGEGFEVFAPLTNKGYGNGPGDWQVIRDPRYRVGRWEQERYWFFYLCFGRMGYNPQTQREVWLRELRQRFGESANDWEGAYRTASRVLPMITALHLPSASEWSWWPEMDTGGTLREYMYAPTSDPGQFAPVRTWQKGEHWPWEDWDSQPGFVERVISGKQSPQRSPIDAARGLALLSTVLHIHSASCLNPLSSTGSDSRENEARMTAVDFELLAELAQYHSSKIKAATQLAFAELADQPGRLPLVAKHTREARDAWQRLVKVTEPVYHHDLVFGVTPDSPRSKAGRHHSGHWRDRLAELDQDVQWIEERIRGERRANEFVDPFPLETAPAPKAPVFVQSISVHPAGDDLSVAAKFDTGDWQATLHYRPLDQTRDWLSLPFKPGDNRILKAIIPGTQITPDFDLQYYVTYSRLSEDGRSTVVGRSPQSLQPYFVVRIEPKKQ